VALSVAIALQTLVLAPAQGAQSCFGKRATIVGTIENDRLKGTPGPDVISGLGGRDRISGRGGKDRICGGRGNDTLRGGLGRDRVQGNAGPDSLWGDQGNDFLLAGKGLFHSFYPGGGNDRLLGARSNRDDVDYFNSPRAVNVNLATGRATGYGTDNLRRIDQIFGSEFDDVLVGDNASNDPLVGGPGNDRILGGGGSDDLFGFTGNDRLSGGAGVDLVDGWRGDDELEGGPGKADFLNYQGPLGPINLNVGTGTARGAGRDTFLGFEVYAGSNHDDVLIGSEGVDDLGGTEGNDTIRGLGGRDIFSGAEGNDSFFGGPGRDVAHYLADTDTWARAVRVNLAQGTATGHGRDSLVGIEAVVGSRAADVILGNGAANRLVAKAGDDRVKGAGGNDKLNGGIGTDRLNGGAGTDKCLRGEINGACEG
jgi:Ca2+-binding RTX toxin-like protein